MAFIDSPFSERTVERWSKLLVEEATKPLWFKKFMPSPEPISRTRRYLNRITNKIQDIKFACGIIFKGKDPYDY